ncbi:CDP-alcohol phosphatidyltransferase family protein [uncultured Ilyobacter sp.]|uniref:CDP-alcohol phosphatidyltransferase family protein n=1 Tax=uncultured Ilyobacter sp. TaxID=544433 RepID=UPI0029C869F5|nr:CDP-alcohol phosphatidyltransferase family protein [uncultured Ilyobacter sp.]
MWSDLKKISNQVTLLRFLFLFIMWLGVFQKKPTYYLAFGFILCGITDFLDGFLARKLNQITEIGSRLDSWADNFLLISGILWTVMLMPEIFTDNKLIFLVTLGTYITFLLVGFIKFRRFANLHLYLSKFSTVVLYAFLVHAFFIGSYSKTFFYFTVGISFISALEGITVFLISSEVNENMGSIIFNYIDENNPIKIWFKRHFHNL